jgi:hypothetical protein
MRRWLRSAADGRHRGDRDGRERDAAADLLLVGIRNFFRGLRA